ncbi:hypothetical protein [Nodosilinea nodulosa]|uniref:hypothetical protein n=1 Tax=Nodosilinea nodulosa TaxID=416001 RepID=UPI00031243F7|nr:hypothetical protein [Nodosilinea nodulosa]
MSEPTSQQPNSETDGFADYLPNRDPIQYGIDVPSQAGPSFPDPDLPNTMDPMGAIAARGEIYRNLKTSHAPWWTVITSWLVLGLPALFTLGFALALGLQTLQELLAAFAQSQGWSNVWQTSLMLLLSLALFSAALLMMLIPIRSTRARLRRQQSRR